MRKLLALLPRLRLALAWFGFQRREQPHHYVSDQQELYSSRRIPILKFQTSTLPRKQHYKTKLGSPSVLDSTFISMIDNHPKTSKLLSMIKVSRF